MKKRTILAADLFCGAGGTSQGLLLAANHINADLELVAVNHWQTAIDTHTLNHPTQRHECTGLAEVDCTKLVPGGRLHVLCASPECTHHSVARGGKPMNDQSRSSPMLILDWLHKLYIDNVIIENVPEFRNWGPLGVDGRPLKSKQGQLFNARMVDFWVSPTQREVPFQPMPVSLSEVEPHFYSCPGVMEYRRGA